jgi:hypothetical protein
LRYPNPSPRIRLRVAYGVADWRALVLTCLGLGFLPAANVLGQGPQLEDQVRVDLPREARGLALRDLEALDRCVAGSGFTSETGIQRLRTEYLLAVEDRRHLQPAWETHRSLSRAPWGRSPSGIAILEGYRGALLALQAKHGFWPHTRVRDLRLALGVLDAQVSSTPGEAEVRYLRLVSAAYLPSLFGRGAQADEDLEALAIALPARTRDFPMRTWTAMADTVEGFVVRRPWGRSSPTTPELIRALRDLSHARTVATAAQIPLAPGCETEDR